jgi:hypothetical protein
MHGVVRDSSEIPDGHSENRITKVAADEIVRLGMFCLLPDRLRLAAPQSLNFGFEA